jgi:drug/metabolite transporter (DMT)-like permease
MLPALLPGYLALAGRVIGLGLERPLVKALGIGRNSITATTLYFGIGELLLLPLIAWQWAADPAYAGDWRSWLLYAASSGLIYAISFNTYVYGMSVGEVSLLTPLYATMFIWLYAMDVVLYGAPLSAKPVLGIAAVTLGIVLLNIAPGRPVLQALNPVAVLRQPGAWGMLVYAFGLALGRIIDKTGAAEAPAALYALCSNAPCVLGGMAWLVWRGRLGGLGRLARERRSTAVIGAFAGMYAYVLMLVALRYFRPSVVEPVSQLSLFIAVGLGGWMFKERTAARWPAAAMVVLGAALLLL